MHFIEQKWKRKLTVKKFGGKKVDVNYNNVCLKFLSNIISRPYGIYVQVQTKISLFLKISVGTKNMSTTKIILQEHGISPRSKPFLAGHVYIRNPHKEELSLWVKPTQMTGLVFWSS